MSIHTDLRSVIYALSDALDLVGVDDVAHGKRVGIMAAECAAELGLGGQEQDFLFDLGMLHDIGVSSTGIHRNLVEQFDWAGSQQHAETGYALLKDYAPLAAMAVPVRYHHTHWSQLQDKGLDPAVARAANLIFLVDRVDALAAPHYASNGVLPHMHQIRDEIARNAGGRFAPELVAAFLTASAREAFWLRLEPRSIQAALQDRLALAGEGNAPTGSLRELARIFSRIVDAKSPFTAEHSLGVAGVACLLARRLGVAPDNVDKLEIAALLHDLGKLRVPDEILDKPGKLDPAERLVINSHSFETFQILRNIKGFEEIAPWAAYHHEEPGGSGYPFHVDAAALPIEARILRVADIFQAMVQDRPYRAGLGAQEALAFLQKLAGEGRIDRTVFATLSAFIDEAMRAARPGASRDVQSEGADHV